MHLINNYPLKNITTLGIGGPAKFFTKVSSEQDLIEAINYTKQNNLDCLVIGGGSNLLISDQGVDKFIIKNEIAGIAKTHLRGEPKETPSSHSLRETSLEGVILKVKSGTVLQDLVDYSISHGLSGLQKLTGIPGTVGGAIYGNAGAYGQTISDHIMNVTVFDLSVMPANTGIQLKNLLKEECGFNYRDSGFKRNKFIILEVTFQLEKGNPRALQQQADEVLIIRLVKYPKGIKCPGSFFKNIVADILPKEILQKIPQDKITYRKISAGYLLEAVGAQGQKLDGIEIAPYHANLFINKGGGTAQAFYNLAKDYAQKVKVKFGITLEPEVQLINLPPL